MIKRNLWSYAIFLFLVLHSLSMSMGWRYRSWSHHVSGRNFLSVSILSNVTAAYLIFLYDTQFLTISFKCLHAFYTVEQCSAINNLSIASARPAMILGHRRGEEFSERGPQIMSNSFKLFPAHFSRVGESFFRGGSPSWLRAWLQPYNFLSLAFVT